MILANSGDCGDSTCPVPGKTVVLDDDDMLEDEELTDELMGKLDNQGGLEDEAHEDNPTQVV